MATTVPSIRPLEPDDDLVRLTELIHSAYAPHANDGLRYFGTYQSVDDTTARYAQGFGLVAVFDGAYVGTITVRPPQPESPAELYREPYTWTIGQFAVSPSFKGRGLGKALHQAAMEFARARGGQKMALDTAAPALGLISMYKAWGYELAGEQDWRPTTNYLSVLMLRLL